MLIFADENIPCVQSAFSTLGEVRRFNGRQLTQAHLRDADVLLVRSVTPVNEKLLKNSKIHFIGTATAGYDHIDLEYLSRNNIAFANAAGSNAISVAEYVVSALLVVSKKQGFKLADKTVGIIGCGNVGSQVLRKLNALGVTCMLNDPPLQEKTGDLHYVDLNTVLSADIITLHVPLEKSGIYPTHHLVNADFLAKLKKNAILINTSRGGVVDETALLSMLDNRPDMAVILDVWENEPCINLNLLKKVTLGTAHIAGYSLDGKVRGTEMLYYALCRYFNIEPSWQAQNCLAPSSLKPLSFSNTVNNDFAIQTAVMACYDVRRDSEALNLINKSDDYSKYFDLLRKNYLPRREFSSLNIKISRQNTSLAQKLNALGFKCHIL